jgi:hypothetical protein
MVQMEPERRLQCWPEFESGRNGSGPRDFMGDARVAVGDWFLSIGVWILNDLGATFSPWCRWSRSGGWSAGLSLSLGEMAVGREILWVMPEWQLEIGF